MEGNERKCQVFKRALELESDFMKARNGLNRLGP